MFNPLSGLVIAELAWKGLFPPRATVVDLGNQTFAVSHSMMRNIVALLRGAPDTVRSAVNWDILEELAAVDITHLATVTKLQHTAGDGSGVDYRRLDHLLAGGGNKNLVGLFYHALGFSSYEAIDVNSRYGSLVMDLNENLRKKYDFQRQFDVVVNVGTSEHLFDQAALFRNAHNLCKEGGVMVHIVPFTGFLNHGFFNYCPNLFHDLALANQYEVPALLMADRNGERMDLLQPNDVSVYFYPYLPLLTPSPTNDTFLVAVLKKTFQRDFAVPIQGKYVGDIEGGALRRKYQQDYERRPTKGLFTTPKDLPRTRSFRFRVRRKVKTAALRWLRVFSRWVLLRVFRNLQ